MSPYAHGIGITFTTSTGSTKRRRLDALTKDEFAALIAAIENEAKRRQIHRLIIDRIEQNEDQRRRNKSA